ncbi:hypothetical protein FB446DRAFT_791231 [Lentinula raphanica]|nr:hypothetical protein FB446DRAFT_791231 [Lentinula raphanica]
MDDDGSSSPYHPSSDIANSPSQYMRHVRRKSTMPSDSIKRQKLDGEEGLEDQNEDDLMLRSSSQTGSKKIHQFYGLGLDDSQLESYPYYENMKTFNDPDNSDHDYKVEESQRGPNGYGYDMQSSDNSDPVLPDDSRLKKSPQIEESELNASDNNIQAALDRALAENRSLSAQITSLNAQNRILLDIIQRLGDIFSDITQPVRRFRAPARFRDSLNAYFLDNGVEESQVD